jgi:uncharacterized Fe-S cluster-containing protein
MDKKVLEDYVCNLIKADVTITHLKGETIISFNGFQKNNEYLESLAKSRIQIETSVLEELKELPDFRISIRQYAHTYARDIEDIFSMRNTLTINNNLEITDNEKGNIEFDELDLKTQIKISRCCLIQKKEFQHYVYMLAGDEIDPSDTSYPYKLEPQPTNLVRLLLSIFESYCLVLK